ncbi:hypothetical protein K466DRAFT_566890 [Polyporus arcularius HHB13444]|uniref:Uncharacterized protein n=1 Tax=Polyporus arcularius HHB13444 TaxID=1314778 RepID=A0A5C3P5Q6_9APHY|nr:hypothetical protein K466DRAFT_566890 [Polyporus arcularius HHB13444]
MSSEKEPGRMGCRGDEYRGGWTWEYLKETNNSEESSDGEDGMSYWTYGDSVRVEAHIVQLGTKPYIVFGGICSFLPHAYHDEAEGGPPSRAAYIPSTRRALRVPARLTCNTPYAVRGWVPIRHYDVRHQQVLGHALDRRTALQGQCPAYTEKFKWDEEVCGPVMSDAVGSTRSV